MNVSKYSYLSDEKLENMHLDLTAMYGKTLWNMVADSSRSLEDKKKEVSLVIPRRELDDILEFLQAYMINKLEELAKIIFISMEKREDFGNSCEEVVSISFCRKIMDIPNNACVTQLDVDRFLTIIDEYDQRMGRKSGDEYLDYIKNYSLEIFGKTFLAGDLNEFNALFELLGADYYLFESTTKHYTIGYVFGRISRNEIDGNKYLVMEAEYIRSPQYVVASCAEVYKDTSVIRRESLEIIFNNKWVNYFSQLFFEREFALYNINASIREGFKKCALKYLGISNRGEALKKKETCIESMINMVVWHEIGHHASFTDMTTENFDFHNTYCEFDHSGYTIMEMMADWNWQKGTITSIVDLSQTDEQLAIWETFVYLSDDWFLDDQDDNKKFSLISYISASLIMQFINTDGTVNFTLLAQEKDRIYDFLLKRFTDLTDTLIENIKSSTFDYGIKKLDFTQLEQRIYTIHQQEYRGDKPYEELTRKKFWLDVCSCLEKFSSDGWQRHLAILEQDAISLEKAVLNLVSKGNEGKYNSLREFIMDRAKETGIMEKIPNTDRFPTDKEEGQVFVENNVEAYIEELIVEMERSEA